MTSTSDMSFNRNSTPCPYCLNLDIGSMKNVLNRLQFDISNLMTNPDQNDEFVSLIKAEHIIDPTELHTVEENSREVFHSEKARMRALFRIFEDKPPKTIMDFLRLLIHIPNNEMTSANIRDIFNGHFPNSVESVNSQDNASQTLEIESSSLHTKIVEQDAGEEMEGVQETDRLTSVVTEGEKGNDSKKVAMENQGLITGPATDETPSKSRITLRSKVYAISIVLFLSIVVSAIVYMILVLFEKMKHSYFTESGLGYNSTAIGPPTLGAASTPKPVVVIEFDNGGEFEYNLFPVNSNNYSMQV